VAAAIASTSRQVGASLGVAVVGAIVSAGAGAGIQAEFSQASHAGWWIVAACAAAVFLLGLASTGRRAKDSARSVARVLGDDAPAPAPRVAMMER
jgi:hypothetical protein